MLRPLVFVPRRNLRFQQGGHAGGYDDTAAFRDADDAWGRGRVPKCKGRGQPAKAAITPMTQAVRGQDLAWRAKGRAAAAG